MKIPAKINRKNQWEIAVLSFFVCITVISFPNYQTTGFTLKSLPVTVIYYDFGYRKPSKKISTAKPLFSNLKYPRQKNNYSFKKKTTVIFFVPVFFGSIIDSQTI